MGEATTRVMVVDDDAVVRASLCAYLEDEGFGVVCAGDAAEALATLEREAVDVAVVDIRLPGMDGQSLILHASRVRPGTRFLVYTGSVSYELPDSLAGLGMTRENVLQKPARPISLLAEAIRRLAGKRIGVE